MLKSIKSMQPCKSISILVFLLTIIINTNRVVANDEYTKIIGHLPVAQNFNHYLSALEKVVDFCIRHKNYVDLNLKVGLILIDVNLRPLLQQKGRSIPANKRASLEKLLMKNDEVSNYFQLMVQKHKNDAETAQNIKLVQLFYNATTWPRAPDNFNKDLLNQTNFYSSKEMEVVYGKWQKYHKNVDNPDEMKPSPAETDECIKVLALNEPFHLSGISQTNCLTSPHCKQVLLGGNEYGYGLTHRILFMVIARFSRRCVVFTAKNDKIRTDMYCKKCFNEAQYIAANRFQLPDLMYEQIAYCGLLGHAQFIRKGWLKIPLRFQTREGCFSDKIKTGDFNKNQTKDDKNDKWNIVRRKDIMNGQCNGHFTAMAAGALSNALRYIIETYY